MEYIIEALAPTTEHDFDRLPSAKQRIYRYIQSVYRKVQAVKMEVLAKACTQVEEWGEDWQDEHQPQQSAQCMQPACAG